MVLSSSLIKESLSLDLPFFIRLSTVLAQMGLQAVKQGQITDNWQKQGPDYWLRAIKAFSCDRASPLASAASPQRTVGDSAPLLRCCRNISNSCLVSSQLLLFLSFSFFKLGGGTLTNTQPKALTLNKVNVDLSVCILDGMELKIFSAAEGCMSLALSHRFKFKNTTAGKCKQRKRSIYSSRGGWFFPWDDAVAAA